MEEKISGNQSAGVLPFLREINRVKKIQRDHHQRQLQQEHSNLQLINVLFITELYSEALACCSPINIEEVLQTVHGIYQCYHNRGFQINLVQETETQVSILSDRPLLVNLSFNIIRLIYLLEGATTVDIRVTGQY